MKATAQLLRDMGYTYVGEYGVTSTVKQKWEFWEKDNEIIIYDPEKEEILKHLKIHSHESTT